MKKNSALRSYALMLSSALLLCCSVFISGCNESVKKEKAVETIVEADSNFPQIMVGAWESEIKGATWGFKIEPDGSIRKVIHSLAGHVDLAEGGTDLEGPDPNTYAIFTMGPCGTVYDEETKVLDVNLVLDYFEMQLPQGQIIGKSEDHFRGAISEDGKVWQAKWFSYSSLEGGSPPDINEINANPETLIFKKIEFGDKTNEPNQ